MPTPLEADLGLVLRETVWGSPDMARRLRAYFKLLLGRVGLGMTLATTPLHEFGLTATEFVPSAAKLAELQQLDVQGREALYRRAWALHHATPAPPGEFGCADWALDLVLEAAHRLRSF